MTVRVRFAPSPTGRLHIGNIRIALMNYIFACQNHGEFLLRIDDTDTSRSTEEFENMIYSDLAWLGLPNQMASRQSNNAADYDSAFEKLKQEGRVYPCFETQEELALARKVQLASGLPPMYKRKHLNQEQINSYLQQGLKPYWRFALDHSIAAEWDDIVHSSMAIQLDSLSDPVIVKPDGGYVYTFASVVDDINMGITHIIRGDDHVTNTAVQIQIFRALCKNEMPIFAHLPLLSSATGEDISKRAGSNFSIQKLRENGAEPFAIIAALASLGTTYEYSSMDNINDVIKKVDFAKISLAAPKFNLDLVFNLTQKVLSNSSYCDVQQRLSVVENTSQNLERYWNVFRKNISKLNDFIKWYDICTKDCVSYKSSDIAFMRTLSEAYKEYPDSWEKWIAAVKERTSRRGAELFHEIRLILTGCDRGPELKDLFYLISPDLMTKRLAV